jgi:hypothetical protein
MTLQQLITCLGKYKEGGINTTEMLAVVEAYKAPANVQNKDFREALEAIASDEGESCGRCEGNGKLWADGKAHYPSYDGPTVNCGRCGGEGRISPDLKQIAIDVLDKHTEMVQTGLSGVVMIRPEHGG